MQLYNQVDREILRQQMAENTDPRVTLSFYQYANIEDPKLFRDELFIAWDKLGVLGRTYVAYEGINAQISVPKENFETLQAHIYSYDFMNGIRLNVAFEDDGKSFIKLKIKVRPKIVADGLDDSTFDASDCGKHLSASEFNALTDKEDTILVDMRNHYETEVGRFEGAICPDVDTFRDELPVVEEMLQGNEDKNIVMYCTGGIRCEKASAYFKHKGFKNVHQLEGGIIKYAHTVEAQGLNNKFKGVNFVFDDRMSERVGHDIISECHSCGKPYDIHVNCINDACHLLFLQCEDCQEKHNTCCSAECEEFVELPKEEQIAFRKGKDFGAQVFKKGRESAFAQAYGDFKVKS
ncbi:MAG: UPF0176 protein [Flavobacteriales bacterium]|jgi:UPF0176 protein